MNIMLIIRLVICFSLISFLGCNKREIKKPFKIVMVSSNYSLAYSIKTIITDSLIQTQYSSGLNGEKPLILWQKILKRSQADRFYKLLNNEQFDTLKSIYSDPTIMDGMQYYFQIDYRTKRKKVNLSNMWIPQLLKLTEIVNSILPDSLKYKIQLPKYSKAS